MSIQGLTPEGMIMVWCYQDSDKILNPLTLEVSADEEFSGKLSRIVSGQGVGLAGIQSLSASGDIAFVVDRSGEGHKILRVELENGAFQDISPEGLKACFISGISVSPDGESIAFAADYHDPEAGYSGQRELYIMSATGGTPRRITYFQEKGESKVDYALWVQPPSGKDKPKKNRRGWFR